VNGLIVIQPGFWTSVQDAGRFGYAHLGIPQSGVMDRSAMAMANGLLNNRPDAAVIECTLKGPVVAFEKDTHFVITGGGVTADCAGKTVRHSAVAFAKAGDRLHIGAVNKDSRVYLAVAGGIMTEKVLGSRSMYAPLTVEKLEKKDFLPIGRSQYGAIKGAKLRSIVSNISADRPEAICLKVYKGPEYEWLSSDQRQALLRPTIVSNHWNRMALQFEQKLLHQMPEMHTAPVIPGTIQCTPDGSLIALLYDCQTTGGYPRVLQLTPESMNLMGQLQAGSKVYWELLS
jgi:biotin-dependent carboxylase-like uncharacterized protein